MKKKVKNNAELRFMLTLQCSS